MLKEQVFPTRSKRPCSYEEDEKSRLDDFGLAARHGTVCSRGDDYASQCGRWTLDMNPEVSLLPLQTLADWSGDGVIASVRTKSQLRVAQTLGVRSLK